MNETNGRSLDEVLAELKQRVEERKESGFYPPNLEHDMAAHFRRISAQRNSTVREARMALAEVARKVDFDPSAIPIESNVPGGKVIHKLGARLAARQIQGVFSQVGEYTATVQKLLEILLDAYEETRAELRGHIEAILERLAAYERTPTDSRIALMDLRRRLEQLESKITEQ